MLFYATANVGLARLVLIMPVGVLYPLWAGMASVTLLAIDWLMFEERLRWTHRGASHVTRNCLHR